MNCFAIHFIRIRIYKNHWKNISVAFTICFCRFHNFDERQLFTVPSLFQLPSLPAGKDSTFSFFILVEASHNLAKKKSVLLFFSLHSWGFWNSATKLGYVFPSHSFWSRLSLLSYPFSLHVSVERPFNHKLALFVILLTVVALTATAYITPFTRGLRAARRPPAECSVRISRSHIHLWWSAF